MSSAPTSPIRFGIVACSSIARRRFLPALAASDCARLERVGSRDQTKARQFAGDFSCGKHGDYEAVLSDPEVDAVYISTPPSLHEEWALKAADSGKHILCEKPAFRDAASAGSVIARCKAAGVCLVEAYSFRLHPQHGVVHSLIEQGRIGQPRFFSGEFTYPRPPDGTMRLDPQLDGGVLHDSAGYPIAAAILQMPGRPVSLFCQMGYDASTGVDDSFESWLHFSEGGTAQTLTAFGAHYRSRYSILGTSGRVEVERAFSVGPQMTTTIVVETVAGVEKIDIGPVDQFRLLVDEFCAQIRGGTSHRGDGEDEMLHQHIIMDAAVRSHREQRMVMLSDYPL